MAEDARRFLPYSATCYVCGASNPLGLQRRFYLSEEGAVETEFVPRPEHCGYHGIVHGGILAALLDETMGWATSVRSGRLFLSVELNLRFLKPAPADKRFIVHGEVLERRRRFWWARGHVRDEEGTVYVRGEGVFYPMSREETEAILRQLFFDARTISVEEFLSRDASEA
jgi:uncharacterized protein (TIGR00369 family)